MILTSKIRELLKIDSSDALAPIRQAGVLMHKLPPVNVGLDVSKSPELHSQKTVEDLQKELKQMQEATQKAERLNYFHTAIKSEYKDFIRLFDGSLESDEDKAQFINSTLFKIQAAASPKPIASLSKRSIGREELKNLNPREITKLYDAGRLNSLIGR